MKNALYIFFVSILVVHSNAVLGQCGATGVGILPSPIGICEGDTGVVNFTGAGTCSGNYQFQVSSGAGVVQAWGNAATFSANPTMSTQYTVSVRCSACPATVVSDTFSIFVTQQPDVSGLTNVCYGNPTSLTASNYTGPFGWYDANGVLLTNNATYTSPNLTSDQTYYAQVTNNFASGGVGSILITECGLAGFVAGQDNDYVEISNLYTVPINTAGWKVAVSNSYTNINLVNGTLWNLPASFPPCSIQSKQDNAGAPNYWGSNMFWNPSQKGWAMIINDVGQVMDFVCWGWTVAEIASLNVTIAGFPITIGTEWSGASCPSACGGNASAMSITRIGGVDNNTAGDFVCQATSLNQLNPGLPCGWNPISVGCSYPTLVTVDLPPTASNPAPLTVSCYADVPVPDPAVVTTEADNAGIPSVVFLSEVSNGLSCPEILTRTYRVSDTCNNYVDVVHTITIDDIIAPVVDPAPANVTVQCIDDVPLAVDLNWTDNCDGSGTLAAVEVSNGLTCPELITRTWSYTDNCGNTTTRTQTITVQDDIAPVIDAPPANLNVQCITDVPAIVSLSWTDNCDGSGTINGTEISNGLSCPETITRTWTYTDNCGNTSTQTQTIVVNDDIAPVIEAGPANINVQCIEDVPAMTPLNWTDNCDGSGSIAGIEVSNGLSCPETITRTWTYTDNCGNTSTEVQTIIVNDVTPPTASGLPTEEHVLLPPPDPTIVADASDNCGTPLVAWVSDVSDGGFCPEKVIRTYSVTDDCNNQILLNQLLIIGDKLPIAGFIPSAFELSTLDTEVSFTNTSLNADYYIWSFDDGSGFSNEVNPVHVFPDLESGGYAVQLIAMTELGCSDTIIVPIQVWEEVIYFIPNTFTPDGDENNQMFQPVFASGFDAQNFHMAIYNRWGETIFETYDASKGWDGTYGNDSRIVPQGIYTWKIEFKVEKNDERRMITGHVQLIR